MRRLSSNETMSKMRYAVRPQMRLLKESKWNPNETKWTNTKWTMTQSGQNQKCGQSERYKGVLFEEVHDKEPIYLTDSLVILTI